MRIEHKIRGGTETFIGDKAQTPRLWKDAIEQRSKELGIEPVNVIGIFLSPGGEPAASPDFGALSFAEFADAVRAAIADVLVGAKGIPGAAALSVLGFMSFYGRT